jgi:hypothetical protein
MRGMLIRGSLLFAATVAFLVIATHAQAESPTIYKWVDQNGIAHYTTDRDNIPSAIRDRVESRSVATPAKTPDVAARRREDVMRIGAPAPWAAGGEPIAAPRNGRRIAGGARRRPRTGAVSANRIRSRGAEPAEAVLETETTTIAAPTPLSEMCATDSAVSSPPPAPMIPLDPEQQAVVAELDEQIEDVQSEIAKREDTLASLISTADEQRTTPLVDDPAFREISQRLPKLQADLQTLRERRNKIQPTASTP